MPHRRGGVRRNASPSPGRREGDLPLLEIDAGLRMPDGVWILEHTSALSRRVRARARSRGWLRGRVCSSLRVGNLLDDNSFLRSLAVTPPHALVSGRLTDSSLAPSDMERLPTVVLASGNARED